ncbi:MAG: hypothetical protein WAN51_06765, partial [Alphaproteobacteria bacterium]
CNPTHPNYDIVPNERNNHLVELTISRTFTPWPEIWPSQWMNCLTHLRTPQNDGAGALPTHGCPNNMVNELTSQ